MKFDIKRAATYFFSDESWLKKSIVMFILLLIGCILTPNEYKGSINCLLLFISFIPVIIAAGYNIYNTHIRTIRQDAQLPEWSKIIGFLKIGIIFTFGTLLLLILACFIGILMIAPLGILEAILSAIFPSISSFLSIIFTIFAYVIGFFISLFFVFAPFYSYMVDLKFSSFFKFKKIKYMAKDNFSAFIKVFFLNLAIGIILVAIAIIISLIILFLAQSIIGSEEMTNNQNYTNIMSLIVSTLIVPCGIFANYICSEIDAQFLRHIIIEKNTSEEVVNGKS